MSKIKLKNVNECLTLLNDSRVHTIFPKPLIPIDLSVPHKMVVISFWISIGNLYQSDASNSFGILSVAAVILSPSSQNKRIGENADTIKNAGKNKSSIVSAAYQKNQNVEIIYWVFERFFGVIKQSIRITSYIKSESQMARMLQT